MNSIATVQNSLAWVSNSCSDVKSPLLNIIFIFVVLFLWYYRSKTVIYTSFCWRLKVTNDCRLLMKPWLPGESRKVSQYHFFHRKLHLDCIEIESRLLCWQPHTIMESLVDPLLHIISWAKKAPGREATICLLCTREK